MPACNIVITVPIGNSTLKLVGTVTDADVELVNSKKSPSSDKTNV